MGNKQGNQHQENLDEFQVPTAGALPGVSGDAGLSSIPEQDLRFSFRLSPGEYRRMLYFHNFGQQRGKSLVVTVAWLVSFVLILLEQFGVIPPLEKVTHGCLLLVSVLIPAMLLTIEFSLYRFRKNNPQEFLETRAFAFDDEGVRFFGQGKRKKHSEAWISFRHIYESNSLFIFYRDNRELGLLPKRAIPEDALDPLRGLLRDKLGSRFTRR